MRTLKTLLLGLSLALCAARPTHAQELTEYNIKAAMLVKFVPYVEWPADKAPQGSVKVCMVGGNPFGEAAPVFKKASNEKIKYDVISKSAGSLSECHIAFFASGTPSAGDGVLTVGEEIGFVDSGGMIGFKLIDNKVKFEINRKSASAAGLKIDARLLELAIKVIR